MPTHPNKEFVHHRLRDAPGVTLPPFSVFDYEDWYSNFFHVVLLPRMWRDGNALQMREGPGLSPNTAFAGWAKRWNHWGGRGTLDYRGVGEETDSPFARCCGEVYYVQQLVEMIAWICEQVERLGEKYHLDYLVVSRQFDCVWFVDHQEYWARDCVFEVCMRITSRRLSKEFVEWHNVGAFTPLPRDRPKMYVLVPE